MYKIDKRLGKRECYPVIYRKENEAQSESVTCPRDRGIAEQAAEPRFPKSWFS